jgi:hypothetical protein
MSEAQASGGTPLRPSEGEPWPGSRLRQATLALASVALRAWARVGAVVEDPGAGSPGDGATERLARWHDGQSWPVRPLRVGVADGGELVEALAFLPGTCAVEWFRTPRSIGEREQAREALDAVVWEDPGGGLRVRTTEHAGREAAWFDLASPRPLSFSSVFPARLDVRQMTLERVEAREATTLRPLVEALALLSRHPERLTLGDRLAGRRPVPSRARRGRATGLEPFRVRTDAVGAVLGRLTRELERVRVGDVPTPAQRCAARLASAWSVAWDGAPRADLRAAGEASARVAADEVEVLLRCAALRLEMMDDDAGVDMLRAACRLAGGHAPVLGDPGAFLDAELRTGEPGARTTARIAVGAALVLATTPPERARFVREDFRDDLRQAPAFVGREQDARFVYEVACELERELAGRATADPANAAA